MRTFAITILFWFTLSACNMLAPPTSPLPAAPTRSPSSVPSPVALTLSTPNVTPLAPPKSTLGSSLLLTIFRNGKNLHELHLIDPGTGQDVPGYALISLGVNFARAFSPDSQSLVVVSYAYINCELNCQPHGLVLHQLDLRTWREVTTPLPFDGWVYAMDFSPDARRLAMVFGSFETRAIGIFDLDQHVFTTQTLVDYIPAMVHYTPDGQSLAAYGAPNYDPQSLLSVGSPRVALLSAADLRLQWEQRLSNVRQGRFREIASDGTASDVEWDPAVVLSSDSRALYIVHADAPRLTTVDFVRRSVSTSDIRPTQSWLERWLSLAAHVTYAKEPLKGTTKQALLSSDGSRLYVLTIAREAVISADGTPQYKQMPRGVQVIDTTRAAELARFDSQATVFSLSPDGSRLYLRGWLGSQAWTEVLDAGALKFVARLADRHLQSGRKLDGQPIVVSSVSEQPVSHLAVLDTQSFEVLRAWSINDYAEWVVPP